MPSTASHSSRAARVARVARGIALTLALIVVAAVLSQLVVSLLPGHSLAQELAGVLWTNVAPWLVVFALVAGFIALACAPNTPWRVIVAIIAGITVLGSSFQIGRVMGAAVAHGGAVNPFAALSLGSPDSDADEWVTYATVGDQDLQAGIWRADHDGPAPVMVLIHGGGWAQGEGDARAMSNEAQWWSDRGWLVASIEYRLSTPDQPTWDLAPSDVACALGWVAANAVTYGGDGTNIVVLGVSAGGNLALNLAFQAASGTAVPSCDVPVPVPAAVAAYVPVVDPLDTYEHGVASPINPPEQFVSQYIGGLPSEYPDRITAISTATFVSAAAPPTLIVEPVEDGYVPSEGVIAFGELAAAAGVPITVAQMPVYNHFAGVWNGIGTQANRTIAAAWLEDAVPAIVPQVSTD